MRGNQHRLPFGHCRKVGRTDGELDPDAVEIGYGEQLSLQIIPSDRRPEVHLAIDHASRYRRANFLSAQAGFRLVEQRRELMFCYPQWQQLLPGNVEVDLCLSRGTLGSQ